MLDIIIVIILTRRIISYAKLKELKTSKWAVLFVLNWFMFEILGAVVVISMLNIEFNMEFISANPGYALLISFFSMGCGFLGYFMTKRMMDRSIV